MTVREYYCHYENFFAEDLNLFLEILSKMHPELMPYAEEYLSQNYQYYCNMFIMKKEDFIRWKRYRNIWQISTSCLGKVICSNTNGEANCCGASSDRILLRSEEARKGVPRELSI